GTARHAAAPVGQEPSCLRPLAGIEVFRRHARSARRALHVRELLRDRFRHLSCKRPYGSCCGSSPRAETISSFCEWRAATVVWGWACRRAHCDWDDSCAGGWGSPRAHGLCCSVACLLVGVEAVSAAGRIHPGGSLYAAYRCRRSGRTASSYPMALGVLG